MSADYGDVRTLLSLVVSLALVGAADAYTATNAVGAAQAGSGGDAISGYAVSGISYEVAGDEIAAVSFDLAPANATSVRVRLALAGPWHGCTLVASRATCATPGSALADAVALHVVATS